MRKLRFLAFSLLALSFTGTAFADSGKPNPEAAPKPAPFEKVERPTKADAIRKVPVKNEAKPELKPAPHNRVGTPAKADTNLQNQVRRPGKGEAQPELKPAPHDRVTPPARPLGADVTKPHPTPERSNKPKLPENAQHLPATPNGVHVPKNTTAVQPAAGQPGRVQKTPVPQRKLERMPAPNPGR